VKPLTLQQDPIRVAIALETESGYPGMLFAIFSDYTGFADPYTNMDLTIAHAVLLDLADAISARLKQGAH